MKRVKFEVWPTLGLGIAFDMDFTRMYISGPFFIVTIMLRYEEV